MRILCFTDNHFSEKSSIVTKYGTKYTLRLENQVESLNWLETIALKKECDYIIGCGDFFDKAQLTDQELTALGEIQWSNIPHYFLVGNHESEENDLQYSSTMALRGANRMVINEPSLVVVDENTEFAFLPYIVESNKKDITEYFSNIAETDKLRLMFSHNDIKGIQLGPVVSKSGFTVEELSSCSHLCINGHLHNGMQIGPTVINLGNLCGKDFSEDADRYLHRVMIIDTDSMSVDFVENPYSFNFYKLEINVEADLARLNQLKPNAVVSLKCKDNLVLKARSVVEQLANIVESRIIITKDAVTTSEDNLDISMLCVDQCAKFIECCREKLDNTDILEFELAEILK